MLYHSFSDPERHTDVFRFCGPLEPSLIPPFKAATFYERAVAPFQSSVFPARCPSFPSEEKISLADARQILGCVLDDGALRRPHDRGAFAARRLRRRRSPCPS